MLELINRRNNLFEKMKDQSVAIIFAGVAKVSSEDETLPFVVNRNFYYLTNIKQEESVLVLVKGLASNKTYLFVQEYNELKEKWTGKRLTNDQASQISSIQNVYSLNNFENTLNLILDKNSAQFGRINAIYMDLSPEIKIGDEKTTKIYTRDLREKYGKNIYIDDIYPLIRDLRMVKSAFEIENIVKAINATNTGLVNIIKNLKPGIKEYELADIFEFYGRQNERRELSFPTIVAAGKNATCLHYPSQLDTVKDGDLVEFDLGYRNDVYCADITRCYPVNGKFNVMQKTIYNAVLACNKAVIEHIRAGMTLKELNEFTIEFLKNECIRLNLMDSNDDIKKYYFHNVSHHLGLDTHDVALRERPLENGNVITVEPGLYFDKYGIGIRIEDDVVIRNGVAEVLSTNVKKEIEEIEKLFQTRGF